MDESIILDDEQFIQDDISIPEFDQATSSSDPLAVYSEENPLPVTIVEEQESGSLFATMNSAYGTISDTYLDYFAGIVEKLDFNDHYVIWRDSDYSYTLAYGDDMSITGTLISGYDLDIVQIYRESNNNYNSVWYTGYDTIDNLELNTSRLFAYSDLGNLPTVKRGLSSVEGTMLIFAVGVAVAYSICHEFFDFVLEKLHK